MDACPADRTKRSRSGQSASAASYRRMRVKSTCASGASAIGVPGWPELAFWTASIDSVRIVLMHSSSRAARSVVTDNAALLLGLVAESHATRTGRPGTVRGVSYAPKGSDPLGRRDLPMYGGRLRRSLDHVRNVPAEEPPMQSFYTSTIVNQIVEDRVGAAARARRSPRRRRLSRAARRDAAPLSTPSGRLRVSG